MVGKVTITCSLLLFSVIVLQSEAEIYSIESAASLSGAPVGFYRRTGLGRDEENIASLSGAKVGVYSKRERFQSQLVPVPYGRFLSVPGPKKSLYAPSKPAPPAPKLPATKPVSLKPATKPVSLKPATKPVSLKPATKPKAGVGGRNLVGSLLGGILG